MLLRNPNSLKAARLQQHYTMQDLANLARCSKAMIGHLETGYKKSCTPELAVRIEKALRVAPGALFVARVSTVHRAA